MSKYEELAVALQYTRRRLYGLVRESVLIGKGGTHRDIPLYQSGEVERFLRVEVTEEFMHEEILYNLLRNSMWTWDKPITMLGVSVYPVRHTLPDCGWRIVDPTVEL